MSDTAAIPTIEADIRDIKAALVRLELMFVRMDEGMNSMATREELARVGGALRTEIAAVRVEVADVRMEVADLRRELADVRVEVADVRVEVANVRADLANKPTRAGMWAMAIALVVTSIGVGAAYLPLVSRVLHQ